MSSVKYSNYSQYKNTPQTSWYLDLYEDIDFTSDVSDEDYIIESKYKHRPDLLAYDRYGNAALLYIFFLINDEIFDPIFDMIPGNTIKVPTASRVQKFFGNG